MERGRLVRANRSHNQHADEAQEALALHFAKDPC